MGHHDVRLTLLCEYCSHCCIFLYEDCESQSWSCCSNCNNKWSFAFSVDWNSLNMSLLFGIWVDDGYLHSLEFELTIESSLLSINRGNDLWKEKHLNRLLQNRNPNLIEKNPSFLKVPSCYNIILYSQLFFRWRKEKEMRKEEELITGLLLLWSLIDAPQYFSRRVSRQ